MSALLLTQKDLSVLTTIAELIPVTKTMKEFSASRSGCWGCGGTCSNNCETTCKGSCTGNGWTGGKRNRQ